MKEKYDAIIEDIKNCQKNKQPVLIGTASIESSEYLSRSLKKQNIPHYVLNAKQHEKESLIIENAGSEGAVTIATNMAGRGTDIVLGGKKDENDPEWKTSNKKVKVSGGLHVIGTERHESRRVDNQLRGRAGRQGDPGSSRFYLSLEDNLMRIFASDKVSMFMKKIGMEQGEAIEHKWVTRAISNAQKKVEGHNFDIRKHLLEYDDVANEQRKYIYSKRNDFLKDTNRIKITNEIIEEVFTNLIEDSINSETTNDIDGILQRDFNIQINASKTIKESAKKNEAIKELLSKITVIFNESRSVVPDEIYLEIIKEIYIYIIDKSWIEHIQSMDYLRQGIGLRSYAQKNPKQEYKREAFEMFSIMQNDMYYSFIGLLFRLDYKASYEKKEVTNDLSLMNNESQNTPNQANNKVNKNKNFQKRIRKSNKRKKK